MINYLDQLERLKDNYTGKWAERILSQLRYAAKLSEVNHGSFDAIISKAVSYINGKVDEEGAITKSSALETESMLMGLSKRAKSLNIICAAHAHIDMNWMWGYAETVAITLDTFRTILKLMEEYPEFTFSQSQASVYKIVEENDPAMLEEIKARVKEGRWEVTASTWVETDKNMPNGESLARHILYTKKYLSELLELDPDSLQIDFEPDTFGHNLNVPEILSKGGVKYYYHCRGYEGYNFYRWQSPSGRSVIVYREPHWYNAEINTNMVMYYPELCAKHGMDTALKVYGVGDHGGGPTRRDIEKLIEMAEWPVFPTIKFGTFAEFFNSLDKISEQLPVVDQELNFVFSGCYTTQTRIKLANRISEAKMYEAEAFGLLSKTFADGGYPLSAYEKAWEKLLFNHFHDILPGSGVVETREYAMGQFQQILATANTGISGALRNIAAQINTEALNVVEGNIGDTCSEGAGVGYGIQDYGIPQTERGRGRNRIFHIFNPSAKERNEITEIVVWDWPGDQSRISITDHEGNSVRCEILDEKFQRLKPAGDFFEHKFIRLLLEARVPAFGYNTYILSETAMNKLNVTLPKDPRLEKPDSYVLENRYLKVVFDTKNVMLQSLVDKRTGIQLVDPSGSAGVFRLVEEDDSKGMTAWIVGRYINIINLDQNVKIIGSCCKRDALRQWISYSIMFRDSKLDVTVWLDNNSVRLAYDVVCDWQESAQPGKFIPQLNFHMPLAYKCRAYKYDIPFGTIVREAMEMDVPSNGWGMGIPEGGGSAVMLMARTKYGFRGFENSLSITLMRSSYNPDPYPENGIHNFNFAIEVVDDAESNMGFIQKAFDYNHPLHFLSGTKHEGTFSATDSFLSLVEGSVAISSIKLAEDKSGEILIRVYETEGKDTKAVFQLKNRPVVACYVDINEKYLDNQEGIVITGDKLCFKVEKYSIVTVCVKI